MNNWNPPPGVKGWPSRYLRELRDMSDEDEELRNRAEDYRSVVRDEEQARAKQEAYSRAYREGIVQRATIRGRDMTMRMLRIAAARDGRADIIEWLEDQKLPTFGEKP